MDKDDVRNLMDSVDYVYGKGRWTFRESQLDRLARIIAAQHEQEVAKLQGQLSERRTICEAAQEEAEKNFVDLKLAQDEVAQLRAQVAMMRAQVLEAVQLAICWPCEEAASCRYDPSGVLIPVPEWQIDSAPSLEVCKAHPFLQALSAAPDRSGHPERPEESEQDDPALAEALGAPADYE